MKRYNIMILGASYGSLLGIKLLLAGHSVQLVCLPNEVAVINSKGIRVRLPVRGRDHPIQIDSRTLPGQLTACTPESAVPGNFDLVAMAMQEPQYRASEIRHLLATIATAQVPCMSIMNMPPLPYLERLPGLDTQALAECYSDASVWDKLDPDLVTLASPDPQAFRPAEEDINVLQVSLPTNFKVARFESDQHTKMLKRLQSDIEAVRYQTGDGDIELPVKLKVHDSIYVPLAKWSMLLTGNYRCVLPDDVRSIQEAVHSDIDASRKIYEWVGEVCLALGAAPEDMVPFEKYANAALSLAKPSSAARAIDSGLPYIERVDRLVFSIARQLGMQNEKVSEIVVTVDRRLQENQKVAEHQPA